MNKEEFITQLDKLLPNKFGLQLKIFSLAEDYAQQQLLNKHDVSGCKELEAQKPNKGITFEITKYHPEIFIDDVGDVE